MSPKLWLRLLGLSCLVMVGFALPGCGRKVPEAEPARTEDGSRSVGQGQKTREKGGIGRKYALLVGVRAYDHRKLTDLKFTENDAEAMANVLTKGKYDEVVVLTTTRGEKDERKKPTKSNIEAELKRLLKKVTKHDVVLIGLAGHGVQYEVTRDGKKRDESFFCPADTKLIASEDFDKLAETMLPFRTLFAQLDDSGAGSRLLLIDACRNDVGTSRNADTDAMPRPTKGTAALFSCKGGERAFESDKLGNGHGVFFYHVIEALIGAARNEDGDVTWDDLTRHVRRAVVKAVPKVIGDGATQTPHLMANVEGDPVLVRVDAKPDVPGKDKDGGKVVVVKDKDGGKLVVASPKDKVEDDPVLVRVDAKIVKGFLDKDGKNSIGMKLVLIPKGKFTMGASKDKDAGLDETPHEVEISKAFYLGVYEVTQREWKALMKDNPSTFQKGNRGGEVRGRLNDIDSTDDFPVETVSYEDVLTFVEKLNEKEKTTLGGWKYNLPTEAQWEYACRGGSKTYQKYHFGDTISGKDANVGGSKGLRNHQVGSFKPNAFGLYDMHGNVWEWCLDWYGADYYKKSPERDPPGPKDGSYRVYRGGSWLALDKKWSRSAQRNWVRPEHRCSDGGFRLAAVPSE